MPNKLIEVVSGGVIHASTDKSVSVEPSPDVVVLELKPGARMNRVRILRRSTNTSTDIYLTVNADTVVIVR